MKLSVRHVLTASCTALNMNCKIQTANYQHIILHKDSDFSQNFEVLSKTLDRGFETRGRN